MKFHIEQGVMCPGNKSHMILTRSDGDNGSWYNKDLLNDPDSVAAGIKPVVFESRDDAEDWVARRNGSFQGDIQIVPVKD